ncbi:caspase family protein [Variovorax sp. PCZ-1]|uniref:caspase family protein n=1 Tax=Variovorax sp. PCZ-1 TaxID=2835533 RepID=UPI001BCFEEF4|nr:caspase family protein [Variovorax sp. PCZ-1]MBS7808702.1 caspase family protein [Variovorax sp. PCZ-1]
MKILCLHGVNTEENPGASDYWFDMWRSTLQQQLPRLQPADVIEFPYNKYFNAVQAKPSHYISAVGQAFSSLVKSWFARSRGPQDVNPGTISMVAKWVGADGLRQTLRTHLAQQIRQSNPDLIIAHSLGSLMLYDTLLHEPDLAQGRVIITIGSQIAHPTLCNAWGGYVTMIEQARYWFHLHNPYDMVLADQPILIQHPAFTQVLTEHMAPFSLNHDAEKYLAHVQAQEQVWARLSIGATKAASSGGQLLLAPARAIAKHPIHRKQRALLVGINNYPNESDRLSGCVNDVFSMSAMLQDQGWSPDSIRVVLDERATTQGVLDRMKWLLEDVKDSPDEVRVFYFSGHGAQLTQYDTQGEPDHRAETLVTHDMDWQKNVGITDKDLAQLYAHLPYKARLFFIFDCCHSGGLTRGANPAKSIQPPDDIHHRSLKWDPKSKLWVNRSLDLTKMLSKADRSSEHAKRFFGEDKATQKFGRAISRWSDDGEQAKKLAMKFKHYGPFNPIVITSCQEKQYAYEYRHGVESHGAFTYVLTQLMQRNQRKAGVDDLVKQAAGLIKDRLQLNQLPDFYNPGNKLGLFAKAAAQPKRPVARKTSTRPKRTKK